MKPLESWEEEYYKGLLKYSQRLHNGYYCFQPRNAMYGSKRFKAHRIIFMLHHKVKLEIWEVVHHKDKDKLNNEIENLELMIKGDHNSHHHAGLIKVGKFKPHNKLSKEKVKRIKELGKEILKKDGSPNYSKIGKKLEISGLTVANYLNKNSIEAL